MLCPVGAIIPHCALTRDQHIIHYLVHLQTVQCLMLQQTVHYLGPQQIVLCQWPIN